MRQSDRKSGDVVNNDVGRWVTREAGGRDGMIEHSGGVNDAGQDKRERARTYGTSSNGL
ncbi:hypothetical protein BJV78DRAFT_1256555 [Lactifluus subvellereus]|nr:hypothetical protein BJV78DRAFT_1256555 [Lactifluus subvellereus]